MYALLLPSAQRFISPVLENVNVDERTMGVLTGPPMPKCDSPAWMALVESRQPREFSFFIGNLPGWREFTESRIAPELIVPCLRDNRNIQIGGEPIWRLRVEIRPYATSSVSWPARIAFA